MPTPEPGEQWGILGGTFDPVHRGHTTLASEIHQKKRLDGVLLVPAYRHPFKNEQAVASFDHRAAMLRLAASDCEFFAVDEIEKTENLSGYTLDTVRAIKAHYPGVTFFFLVGSDNICQIQKWHRPEEILKEIKVIAGTRPSFTQRVTDNTFASKIEYIETTAVNVSSSGIRAFLAGGGNRAELDKWLDSKVRDYILAENLYV